MDACQYSHSKLSLVTGKIQIGKDSFVGAKAFILPGVHIGEGAVIGACSVVSRDMPAWMICAGNPCRPLKQRALRDRTEQHKRASNGNK